MSFETITLVKPDIQFKDSFLEGLKEFQDEKLPWYMDFNLESLKQNFAEFVQDQLNKKTTWSKDTPVDETELWAIVNGTTYVGSISIRHQLNQDLRTIGGHIGYDTRPSYRGRGIASAMLKQALPIAKKIGIPKVLLTCSDNNEASIRVIEKNGGVLEEIKSPFTGQPLKRYYWISI